MLGSKSDANGTGVVRVDVSGRRWYTTEFKHEIVRQCLLPGTSVSRVSIEHGLNTNLVRKWVERIQVKTAALAPLLPVIVRPPAEREVPSTAKAPIEILAGGVTILIGETASPQQIEAIVRAVR